MKTKYKKNEVLTAVLFLAPSVLLWLFWFLYPALKSMRLSFYDYSFINPERQKFVGLDNYIRLFQDSAFLDALKHTFILAFVVVAFISVLAFIIAVLLEGNIRGKTFFRTVCFMPYIISSVAVSIFFMYFFVKGGLGTRLFMLFGAEDTTWFTNKNYALFFVAIIYIWQQLGFYMILYIGGLQNISEEIYEAAKIDGAGHLRIFFQIIFPLVKPSIATLAVLKFVWTWNDYQTPLIFLSNRKLFTIQLGMKLFASESGSIYPLTMAAAVSATIPLIILFLFGQRYIIDGIASGAVKG